MYPYCVTLPLYHEGGKALEQVVQKFPVPAYVQVGWALSSLIKWKVSLPMAEELE